MAMKQTQTKMFDFADVGLDFCSGSKNLFPDRFKKMLSLGYNVQTVSSVAVTGNQVTFIYGGAHGYAADRVLKVDSGDLALINSGEFWVDSVTTNTVTFTLDDAPASIAGGFTTRIASLGWQLVYEQANIHVYKFKQLDESGIYIRLCFQNNLGHRNAIAACVGSTYDINTGFINDAHAYKATADCLSPNLVAEKWEFTESSSNAFNDWTYAQGTGWFGKAQVVGSAYHLLLLTNAAYTTNSSYSLTQGVVPCEVLNYTVLNKPVLLSFNSGGTTGDLPTAAYTSQQRARIGDIRVKFISETTQSGNLIKKGSISSFLPTAIDGFNTTVAQPVFIYEYGTGQFIGVCSPVLLNACYGSANYPSTTAVNSPNFTYEIDFNSKCITHAIGAPLAETVHFVLPLEPVKND